MGEENTDQPQSAEDAGFPETSSLCTPLPTSKKGVKKISHQFHIFHSKAVAQIRSAVLQRLGGAAEPAAQHTLVKELNACQRVDGVPPNFGCSLALTAYFDDHLDARTTLLAHTFLHPKLRGLTAELFFRSGGNPCCHSNRSGGGSSSSARAPLLEIVSLGGGPGFDVLGAAFLSRFLSTLSDIRQQSRNTDETVSGSSSASPFVGLRGLVLDNESAWSASVGAVEGALREWAGNSGVSIQCPFGFVDILKPVSVACGNGRLMDVLREGRKRREVNLRTSPQNFIRTDEEEALSKNCDVPTVQQQIFCTSYVVVENSTGLLRSRLHFFGDLFRLASVGAVFVFFDVSGRLFPFLLAATHSADRNTEAEIETEADSDVEWRMTQEIKEYLFTEPEVRSCTVRRRRKQNPQPEATETSDVLSSQQQPSGEPPVTSPPQRHTLNEEASGSDNHPAEAPPIFSSASDSSSDRPCTVPLIPSPPNLCSASFEWTVLSLLCCRHVLVIRKIRRSSVTHSHSKIHSTEKDSRLLRGTRQGAEKYEKGEAEYNGISLKGEGEAEGEGVKQKEVGRVREVNQGEFQGSTKEATQSGLDMNSNIPRPPRPSAFTPLRPSLHPDSQQNPPTSEEAYPPSASPPGDLLSLSPDRCVPADGVQSRDTVPPKTPLTGDAGSPPLPTPESSTLPPTDNHVDSVPRLLAPVGQEELDRLAVFRQQWSLVVACSGSKRIADILLKTV
uniref:Uncharacterized protein n=1 Tax=Chromera velia CCMP2878 TaxID=1169474 RepID=A0A0G4IDE5_9ALVE|eukprot:Cvel_13385.t1-p1 / transcript=Cvel_13385.t1 / gene=Cvel_13385 / organism=Chromera_velia_CCMP2878 / gene_product=hypothetical protein / transcript_product=hypothetical protein / location=Cvel_scaffold911:32710-34896(+) / protein_length=729 / sequence_SO=supercontig / SO=protein_coding / is_pseudo=false